MFCFQTEVSVRRNSESEGDAESPEHDPHFEPVVSLPLIDIQTNEEDEEELVKIRARLYRYDTGDHEWKVSAFFFKYKKKTLTFLIYWDKKYIILCYFNLIIIIIINIALMIFIG